MPKVKVSVRTDFTRTSGGKPGVDWTPGEAVKGARVEIVGAGPPAITGQDGVAVLNTDAVKDSPGSYMARISHSVAAQNTDELAGPGVADPLADPPPRIYRPLDFGVELDEGVLVNVLMPTGTVHGAVGHKDMQKYYSGHLPIDWKPVWMGSPVKRGEVPRTKDDIDLIIVHRTLREIGPAINEFLNLAGNSAHYVIDVDGHIVKMAEDLREANHAGCSIWNGRQSVNAYSIGIEVVYGSAQGVEQVGDRNESSHFTESQYQSLLGLIGRLRRAYPTIPAHRIVGHGDIATAKGSPCPTPTKHADRREDDPGKKFDWARLEEAGLGMAPVEREDPSSRYDPTFSDKPKIALRRNDKDPPNGEGTALLGGKSWPEFIGNPIEQLQKDLETIGFSVRPKPETKLGVFGPYTESAVKAFQRHIFAGSRYDLRPPDEPASPDGPNVPALGRVDKLTASWINRVRF